MNADHIVDRIMGALFMSVGIAGVALSVGFFLGSLMAIKAGFVTVVWGIKP